MPCHASAAVAERPQQQDNLDVTQVRSDWELKSKCSPLGASLPQPVCLHRSFTCLLHVVLGSLQTQPIASCDCPNCPPGPK